MFVKTIQSRGHTYLSIVRSVRKNGKPTHETVANLGRVDHLGAATISNIVSALQRYADKIEPSGGDRPDLSTMEEVGRFNYGWLVYGTLWKQFGLEKLLRQLSADRKITYDYASVVFSLVVNHVLNPSSKRDFFLNQDWYSGLSDGIELHHLYRSLDLLAEHKADVETALFHKNRTLFDMKLDVVFFDVTTFYFESQQADTLRDFGFDKDGKINEVQVVMALLIDGEGRPISFELFPGNTFEGHTLVTVLDRLKDRFQIGRVIIVADKGLNSKLNLKAITDRGYDYIVSCRIRNLPAQTKARVLAAEGYETIAIKDVFGIDDDEHAAHTFKYKAFDYTNVVEYQDGAADTVKVALAEQLICSWSSKRAAKDKHDRDRQIEKAQKAVDGNQKSILNHKGYKRYIKAGETRDEPLRLNREKIEADACYDGFAAIQCSQKNLQAVEVMRAYRQLLKIEESFRVMKTTLRARPVFVWTPERIKGHFVMCFLAFVVERELEYRLNRRNIENSPERIKSALRSMQVSQLSIGDDTYYLKGKHESLAAEIWAILKMKQPTNISDEAKWRQYIERQ